MEISVLLVNGFTKKMALELITHAQNTRIEVFEVL